METLEIVLGNESPCTVQFRHSEDNAGTSSGAVAVVCLGRLILYDETDAVS